MGEVFGRKEIAITGKRQITIPKFFHERLQLGETVIATLTDKGILLEPVRNRETMFQEDLKVILNDLIEDGLDGKELIEEFTKKAESHIKLIDNVANKLINDANE